MEKDIKITIDSIFYYLSNNYSNSLSDFRRKGIDVNYIKKCMNDIHLKAPDDFVKTYEFCDGTNTKEGDKLDKIYFFPGFYWMSFDESLASYKALSINDQWSNSWFPIFSNGGGDFYAVICDKESENFGEIVGFVIGEKDQIVEFKNISTMLYTIEKSFREGAFFFLHGIMTADYPKMRKIARQIQPDFMEHEISST